MEAEFAKVVVRGAPFKVTTESGTKLDPVTARAAAGLPARIAVGDSVPMTGTGFLIGRGKGVELPPPGGGFTTAISSVPAFEMSVERTAACKSVELRKPDDRILPFTVTVDCVTKFAPVTNNGNEAPLVKAEVGD